MKCSHLFVVVIAAIAASTTTSAYALYPVVGDDAPVNTATSPYAVNAVKAAIRTAEVGDKKYSEKYGFPSAVPTSPKSKKVAVYNALIIEGTANDELKRLVTGRPLELLDKGITKERLENSVKLANELWNEAVGLPCPVRVEDLTCQNQTAAGIACCSARFPMDWEKTIGKWLGNKVNEAFQINNALAVEENGKVYLKVDLGGGMLYIVEGQKDLSDVKKVLKNAKTSSVIIPNINIDVKNDFEKNFEEFFNQELLCFHTGAIRRSVLGSFVENVSFSMNEQGVFGVSVVSFSAFEKGIFGTDQPIDDDVIYVDEPFKAYVETTLKDGTDAVIFEVEVNNIDDGPQA